jgi:hypothetical protein
MDLVRRKLMLHGGRLPQRFFDKVRADFGADFITTPLSKALDELASTTQWLQQSFKTSPDDAAFGCTDYLRAFALTYLGWNWLRMLRAAEKRGDARLLESKRITAMFFARRMLPQVHSLCATVKSGAAEMMALAAENF